MRVEYRLFSMLVITMLFTTCEDESDTIDLTGFWQGETQTIHAIVPFFGEINESVEYKSDFNVPMLEVLDGMVYLYQNSSCTPEFDAQVYVTHPDGDVLVIDEYLEPELDSLVGTATISSSGNKLKYTLKFEADWGEYTSVILAHRYNADMPPESWSLPLAPDSFEPDSLESPGTFLEMNGNPVACTLLEGDTDYFQFHADSAASYFVFLEGAGVPSLRFRGSYSASYGPNSGQMQITIDEPGDYVLWAYDDDNCSEYSISIRTSSQG